MHLPRSIIQFHSFRKIHFLTIAMAVLVLGFQSIDANAASSQLVCIPNRVDIGAVVVGQTGTSIVTVMNSGQTSVTVSGISAGNAAFTMSYVGLPLVLSSGQSVALGVSFTPTALGWAGSTIKFASANGAPVLQFQVDGTGVNSQAVTANPATVSFGQVAMGTTSTVPVVLTNARSWSVTLKAAQTTGGGFSVTGPALPLTLGQGQSVTLNVSFTPQSAGTSSGGLFVAGPQLAIPLTGQGVTPGQLVANPASLAFGSVQVGANVTLTDSLTNTGGSSVTISQATVAGTGFSINGLSFPLVLNPGASVTFSAIFAPQSAANATGGIAINSNASNSTLTVPLSGTGAAPGQLIVAPIALNFGNVTVGTTASQASSISAGGASVTVSSASLNSSEFSLSGISFPITIAAGQSVPVTLSFSPQTSGTANAALSVTSNAGNNPGQNLTGVGMAQIQHNVALTWTDSNSGVAGYNVYRGSVSGGPYAQINSGLAPTTAYTDSSVASGQTYYYVATAVSEGGTESGYSNEAQGVIPTP